MGRKSFGDFARGGSGCFDWPRLWRACVWTIGGNELVNGPERGQSRGHGSFLLSPYGLNSGSGNLPRTARPLPLFQLRIIPRRSRLRVRSSRAPLRPRASKPRLDDRNRSSPYGRSANAPAPLRGFQRDESRSNRISISAFIGVYLRGLWAAMRPWLSKSTDHGVMRHVRPDAGWWGRPVVGEVGKAYSIFNKGISPRCGPFDHFEAKGLFSCAPHPGEGAFPMKPELDPIRGTTGRWI